MTCVDKATPGRCVWRMRADERFANPAGIMQGGFLGAFADSAMGAAAVTYVEGRQVFCSNAEMKISFLGAVPPGADLTCTAEVVSGGRRVAFVEASVVARVDGRGGGAAGGPGRRRPTSTRTATEAAGQGGVCRRRPTDQDCGPHGTIGGQRHPRAAQRGGRRLPAHGRLPQAGGGRSPAGAGPLPLHGDRAARSSWPSASCWSCSACCGCCRPRPARR